MRHHGNDVDAPLLPASNGMHIMNNLGYMEFQ